MSNPLTVTEIRERYIALTRQFFAEIDKGREPVELQPLQQEIENTLLELDRLEKEDKDNQG